MTDPSLVASMIKKKTQYYMDRLDDAVDFRHRSNGITQADLVSLLTSW